MPADYLPWWRMSVDDLPPREYWQTAQEDIELCTAIQQAVRRGEAKADDEAREARKKQEQNARWAQQEREAQERLKQRMGG